MKSNLVMLVSKKKKDIQYDDIILRYEKTTALFQKLINLGFISNVITEDLYEKIKNEFN